MSVLTPWIWPYMSFVPNTCRVPTISVLTFALLSILTMLFRRCWRRGVIWWRVLLAGVPTTHCLWSDAIFPREPYLSFWCNKTLWYSIIVISVLWIMTLILSDLLKFWWYVWNLDPGHTYDEHPVLPLKLGVTEWYQSHINRRNDS
jgi:hypothetical protein